MDNNPTARQNQAELLAHILEISRRMSETRDLEPLLEYVMQQAVELTGGDHGYLVLLNENENLDFRVTYGSPYEGDNENTPVSRSIIQTVLESGRLVNLTDALEDSSFQNQNSVLRMQLRSVLCVPLSVQGELLGVLYLENRKRAYAFHEEDIPLVMIFASQAAVSIKNAQLNEQQKQLMANLETKVQERTAESEKSRRQAEAGWAAALEENRLRTALLGNITHDLRSPLNVVVNALQWMEMGEFGPITSEQAEWLERALKATKQVLRLVNDIFDLSKIEQGKLELFPKEIELVPLLEQTFSIAEGLKRKPNVELGMEIAPNLPKIWADPDRVQQILVNLFTNGFKYTQRGRITLRVEAAEALSSVLFQVEDTGQGIPKDLLPLLFERFSQLDEDAEMRRGGTGIGLAICKELVERQGGEIWAESEVGVGTTFFFTLPIAEMQ